MMKAGEIVKGAAIVVVVVVVVVVVPVKVAGVQGRRARLSLGELRWKERVEIG